MSDVTDLAVTAALLGDPARAAILQALMDGRALTAKELAFAAHVSPQTTSGHLAKLTEAELLSVAAQGRHRYFRLASAAVAEMVEAIMAVAAKNRPMDVRRMTWKGGEALRTARTCYDHIAGRLGVAIADRLVERGHVLLADDGGEVTADGQDFLAAFGAQPAPGKRVFCRACLDWSERRPHLAGRVGAAIACRCFELGWIARMRDSRALTVTSAGRAGFAEAFGVALS
ncbi:MAG TPA: helix-turn-helix transcriptional regulator [Acetobacteraceae bacterium]|nr:helix-turn-helix transcriptional regulator [Acetobacteraceae bacterium]